LDEFTIRPAVAGDLVGHHRHLCRCGRKRHLELRARPAEPRRNDPALRGALGRRFPYIVAEAKGRILGYAYAGAFRPRPAYRFAVEDSIYVAPDAKGRGVGRGLLANLIEECRGLGFRQMLAVIGDARPDSASVRLHERMGFSHAGLLKGTGYKHGRWLDTGFMQLEMNGGTTVAPDPDSLPERRFQASRLTP
jgi:L-amino acid N-acyltransferase YncA